MESALWGINKRRSGNDPPTGFLMAWEATMCTRYRRVLKKKILVHILSTKETVLVHPDYNVNILILK